jgi:hypothetical protein
MLKFAIANQYKTLKNARNKKRNYIINCCGTKSCFGEKPAAVNRTVSTSLGRVFGKVKTLSTEDVVAKTDGKYSSLQPQPGFTAEAPPDPEATALNPVAETHTSTSAEG